MGRGRLRGGGGVERREGGGPEVGLRRGREEEKGKVK